MSAAIVENLSNAMTPDELAAVFETVVFHGAPWPMGPVEVRRVPRCPGCTAPVEREGVLCDSCESDRQKAFYPRKEERVDL